MAALLWAEAARCRGGVAGDLWWSRRRTTLGAHPPPPTPWALYSDPEDTERESFETKTIPRVNKQTYVVLICACKVLIYLITQVPWMIPDHPQWTQILHGVETTNKPHSVRPCMASVGFQSVAWAISRKNLPKKKWTNSILLEPRRYLWSLDSYSLLQRIAVDNTILSDYIAAQTYFESTWWVVP